MAFNLNPEAQAVFFDKVFGATQPTTKNAKALIEAGVEFQIHMYTCKATYGGKTYQQTLLNSTTSLMKGTLDAPVVISNKMLITAWIDMLCNKFIPSKHVKVTPEVKVPFVPMSAVETKPKQEWMWNLMFAGPMSDGYGPNAGKIWVIKLIRTIAQLGLKEAKDMSEQASISNPVVLGMFPEKVALDYIGQFKAHGGHAYKMPTTVPYNPEAPSVGGKPQLTPDVIALKDAKALGQKVNGTSTGSVYHCIAVGSAVRMAARIKLNGEVSIRAEWESITQVERDLLKYSGMNVKPSYASIHLSSENIPAARIIGGFLLGMGMTWDQVVTSAQELVSE